MKNWKSQVMSVNTCMSVTCDICNKTYDDIIEMQEFINIRERCGYGNMTFGDCTEISLDMCQYCFKERLGEYVRLGYPMEPIESLLDGEE